MVGSTTFGAFTTARLGIYAAQKALSVTGNNISNINTMGYTRQVLNQMSLRTGGNDGGASIMGAAMGSGVLVTGLSQLRDPYLDIRFRAENSTVGALETKMNGLDELSKIIDEVAKGDDDNGLLLGQLNDIVSRLAALTGDQATSDEALNAVREAAKLLTGTFKDYAERLNTVVKNQEASLEQNVDNVNDILKQIQELNQSIQRNEIYGDNALELRDQRNLLLDELSQYVKVDITYVPVSMGAGDTVDKLVIKTAGDPKRTLVDGNYAGRLSIGDVPMANPAYDPDDPISDPADPAYDPTSPVAIPYMKPDGTLTDNPNDAEMVKYSIQLTELKDARGVTLAGSEPVVFGDTELYGALQAGRELLTERGEFTSTAGALADPDAAGKRGIPYYQNALDAMARKFATAMNEANTGYMRNSDGNFVDQNGDELMFNGAAIAYPLDPVNDPDYQDIMDILEGRADPAHQGILLGGEGPLFSNSGAGDGVANITAANISISKSWASNAVKIQNSMVMVNDGNGGPPHVGSTSNDNILHLKLVIDGDQVYLPGEINGDAVDANQKYFEGSFLQFATGMQSTLGMETKSTTSLLNSAYVTATTLDVDRESVAGVDLNDEAMSMMQYQKSYSAACRLMTTIDEVLDKLINGTGVVGR